MICFQNLEFESNEELNRHLDICLSHGAVKRAIQEVDPYKTVESKKKVRATPLESLFARRSKARTHRAGDVVVVIDEEEEEEDV